jgi:hypothetical protein
MISEHPHKPRCNSHQHNHKRKLLAGAPAGVQIIPFETAATKQESDPLADLDLLSSSSRKLQEPARKERAVAYCCTSLELLLTSQIHFAGLLPRLTPRGLALSFSNTSPLKLVVNPSPVSIAEFSLPEPEPAPEPRIYGRHLPLVQSWDSSSVSTVYATQLRQPMGFTSNFELRGFLSSHLIQLTGPDQHEFAMQLPHGLFT